MILVPPVSGSVLVVDRMGDELRRLGFTVISFSREAFDYPAIDQRGGQVGFSLIKPFKLFQIFLRGMTRISSNAQGRALEAGKVEDIKFLLDYIQYHRGIPGFISPETDFDCLFITGYHTGGAALLLLAGNQEFIAQHITVRGIIAVEGPPLSVLEGEPPLPPAAFGNPNWIIRTWERFRDWSANLGPKRITRVGETPALGLPVCLILSDRVLREKDRIGRYGPLLQIFWASEEPGVWAALSGAGLLDYTDIPRKYPLYSFLFPGYEKPALPREDMSSSIAALITNFTLTIMENDDMDDLSESFTGPRRLPETGLHIETNGAWNSPDKGYILTP
jgi:hypothetical protein